MNSDRTGFYAFLGASAVAALLAIVSVLNPFGSSSSDVETSAQTLAEVPPSTPVAMATPHPTAAMMTPTPTPTPKAKPKPKPTQTEAPVSTSAGATATKKAATQTAPKPVSNTTANNANNTGNTAQPTATPDPAAVATNNGGGNGDGATTTEQVPTDSEQAPTAITGPGTTGTVGGPTAASGSRALSAAEAATYVAYLNNPGRAAVFDAPNGQEIQTTYQWLDGSVTDYALAYPTEYGNHLALRVVSGSPGDEWVQVALPIRPNGQTGWVRSSDFTFDSSNWYVEINVSNNSVSVWNGEELVAQTPAVTGSSSTPTPLGSGFIEEKITGLGPAYGPALLSLGLFSNAHNSFGGGVPKIALHGTNQPELMGQYASNGCIRVPNDVIAQLANMIPIGTRVQIVG